MRERNIEDYLHRRVLALGGEYRRMQWTGRKHAPDDFVMLYDPPRHMLFECKRPGEVAEPGQVREHDRLRRAGVAIHTVTTCAEIDAILPLN